MNFKNALKIICAVCLLLIALWVWFTRPISIVHKLNDKKPVKISVTYITVTPGADGHEASDMIYTSGQSEMNEAISLMKKFPCSKKLFDRSAPYSAITHTIEIRLYYQTKDKRNGVLSFSIGNDGRIRIADWGQKYHDYGVGRFGTKKGQNYYLAMKKFFDKKKLQKSWEWQ